MTDEDGAPAPEEARWLREGLGEPGPERVRRALSEVEQQIALEDLVLMIVETAQDAARAFIDVLSQVHTDVAPHRTETSGDTERGGTA